MVLGNEVEHFLLSRGLVVSALVSGSSGPRSSPGGPFLEAPGNYRAHKAVLFSIPDGSFKSFEYYTVKLLAKETKWTLLEFRTHPTFLEILISKSDFGPVKLPGLSRNGPQVVLTDSEAMEEEAESEEKETLLIILTPIQSNFHFRRRKVSVGEL